MLNTMGGTAGESIHESVAEEIAELTHSIFLLQSWVNAVVERIADAGDTDALSCV